MNNVIKIIWSYENNAISTNPLVLLVTCSAYYPVRIIKPLYVKKFLLQVYSSNIKAHLGQ